MTENAEHSRLVARANKEAPACDEEAQRSLSYAWLIIKENISGHIDFFFVIETLYQTNVCCMPIYVLQSTKRTTRT